MALAYLDASALVKLVRDEPESQALSALLEGAEIVSSELLLTEVPRAISRAVADDPQLSLDALINQASDVLGAIAMAPLDPAVLITAGALQEPTLRALDAIHVAAALELSPVDAFVSYDERQSAVARLSGLRTLAPAPPEITKEESSQDRHKAPPSKLHDPPPPIHDHPADDV